MITAILIDDEKNALEVLELQLMRYCPDVNILAACDSGEKGIAAIKKYHPDVVFVDIEMPHKNGFDVLKETTAMKYQVIYTTAYDQFAIKAFKFSAIDYLLKPIDIVELQNAVAKAGANIGKDNLEEKLKVLISQYQPSPKLTQKIAIPNGDAMQFFDPDDIIRCESDSNYTQIYLNNGKKLTLAKTLKEVEEIICGSPFFRLHHSHLVNLNYINKYIKGDNAYVVMKDGMQINISRNRKDAFLQTFRKL
jgi:two-component system LytT family response regulator